MLKVLVDDKHIEMTTIGDIQTICADLSHVLSSLNQELSKSNPKIAHTFRVLFTKGFMDGVCFDDDREHMEHYLAEGDECSEKADEARKEIEKSRELADAVNGVIEFLKQKRAELVRAKEELDKQLGKDSEDEAE